MWTHLSVRKAPSRQFSPGLAHPLTIDPSSDTEVSLWTPVHASLPASPTRAAAFSVARGHCPGSFALRGGAFKYVLYSEPEWEKPKEDPQVLLQLSQNPLET